MSHPADELPGTVMPRVLQYLWLLWVIWLSFLIYPLHALFVAHPSATRLALVLPAAVLFAAVYSWNIWRNVRRLTAGLQPASPWLAIGIMVAIGLALMLGDRRDWIELFIYVGVSMGPSLPVRQAVRAVAIVVLLMIALGVATGVGIGTTVQIALQGAVSGYAVIIVVRTVVTERELRLARSEIARLAVSEERLRFARDLHDLLGHSLSLIALKSELVGRLIPISPERAAAENRDVEAVARRALAEVREAVAGYRQPALGSEIENAREILGAAGIRFECDGDLGTLPPAAEAVLAWTVREGVTNVIKHSRARRCALHLTREDGTAGVEIADDGVGQPGGEATPGAEPDRVGSGLTGLEERVGALGGHVEAAAGPGGFRLSVTVPVRRDIGDVERTAGRDSGAVKQA